MKMKRLVIIVSASLVLAVVIVYGALSYTTWSSFDQRSNEAARTLKASIDSSLAKDSPITSAEQLDAITDTFSKKYGESPCTIPPLSRWQVVIPALKSMVDTCDQQFAAALKAVDSLKPLSQYMKDQAKASALLETTLKTQEAPTDYTAASDAWKQCADSAELLPKGAFEPVGTKIKTDALALSRIYAELAMAINDEDKSGFDTAAANINDTYASLANLPALSQAEQQKLINQFITQYEKL